MFTKLISNIKQLSLHFSLSFHGKIYSIQYGTTISEFQTNLKVYKITNRFILDKNGCVFDYKNNQIDGLNDIIDIYDQCDFLCALDKNMKLHILEIHHHQNRINIFARKTYNLDI